MIELKNVWRSYGRKHASLSYGSLVFKQGEITGILGENGSGKTTLLKAIMGLGPVSEGEILIDGSRVRDHFHCMAFITEEGSFIPAFTPREYGRFLADFFPRFDSGYYRRLLDFFGLPEGVPIRTFSKGQKSKLEISAGFSKKADYILLDEPLLGHDLLARSDLLKLLLSQLQGHETVLVATHQIGEIQHLLDRAVILQKGSVAADVYIEELQQEGKDLTALMKEIARYQEDRYKELFPPGPAQG